MDNKYYVKLHEMGIIGCHRCDSIEEFEKCPIERRCKESYTLSSDYASQGEFYIYDKLPEPDELDIDFKYKLMKSVNIIKNIMITFLILFLLPWIVYISCVFIALCKGTL